MTTQRRIMFEFHIHDIDEYVGCIPLMPDREELERAIHVVEEIKKRKRDREACAGLRWQKEGF